MDTYNCAVDIEKTQANIDAMPCDTCDEEHIKNCAQDQLDAYKGED